MITVVKLYSIIHVNNPSTNICINDECGLIEINRKRREKSRTILLDHLMKVCKENYKFKTWDKLRDDIADYIKTIEEDENSGAVAMDKVAEIVECRLNSEILLFIKAFNKIKENCSIV